MTNLQHEGSVVEGTQSDPYYNFTELQGIDSLTDYHVRLTNSLTKYRRIAVKSCHGVGKTWWAAKVVLWYLPSFYGAKIITTAPTARMVNKLLWSEIKAGYRKSVYKLGGEMLPQAPEWRMNDEWFAIGYSPAKEAGIDSNKQISSTFQGFHAPKIALLLDEATGVSPQIWMQIEGMTTSGDYLIIAIGNPTSKSCEFFNCFHGPKSHAWKQFTITCFDSPNLKANGIHSEEQLYQELELLSGMGFDEREDRYDSYKIIRPELLTYRWVMERAMDWGIKHPLFRSKALAEFPEEDDNALFTLTQVTNAINRRAGKKEKVTRRCIGVDPARFGTDKTIITVMEDEQVTKRIVLIKKRTTHVSGEIINVVRGLKLGENPERVDHEIILVDGTGIGAGVVDELIEAKNNQRIKSQIVECHFGAGAADPKDTQFKQDSDKEHYANFKAKIFQMLAKDLSDNIVLSLDEQDSEVYQDQLPTINYLFDSKGRLIIESKDDYQKRTGRHSPDESDSFALANWGRHVRIIDTTNAPRVYRL